MSMKLYRMVADAIPQGKTEAVEQELSKYGGADASSSHKVLLTKLHAILKGDRDPALASDPELNYAGAAELQLLLERLNAE